MPEYPLFPCINSKFNHGQQLVFACSSVLKLERDLELPAMDEDVEMAVYKGACT